MRGWLLFLVLFWGGCAIAPCASGRCVDGSEPIQASLKASVIWGVYGESGALPGITWVEQGDCQDGRLDLGPSGCRSGDYIGELDHAWIVTTSPEADWTTILVHELLHAHLSRAYGDGDPQHQRPEWIDSQRAAFAALPIVLNPIQEDSNHE